MKKILAFTVPFFLVLPVFAGIVFEVETKSLKTSPGTVSSANISIDGTLVNMDIAPGRSRPRGILAAEEVQEKGHDEADEKIGCRPRGIVGGGERQAVVLTGSRTLK